MLRLIGRCATDCEPLAAGPRAGAAARAPISHLGPLRVGANLERGLRCIIALRRPLCFLSKLSALAACRLLAGSSSPARLGRPGGAQSVCSLAPVGRPNDALRSHGRLFIRRMWSVVSSRLETTDRSGSLMGPFRAPGAICWFLVGGVGCCGSIPAMFALVCCRSGSCLRDLEASDKFRPLFGFKPK